MIQKRAFSINSNNNSKSLCFLIVLILSFSTLLAGSVLSNETKYLSNYSCVYNNTDAEIYLSEGRTDNGYVINLEIISSDYKSNSILRNSQSYLSLSLGDSTTFTSDIGKPKLPTIQKLIAVPYNTEYSLNILDSEYNTVDLDKKILPFQEPSYDCEGMCADKEFTIDEEMYNTDDFYPKDLASVLTHGVFRDFQVILLRVNPFKYNSIKNELKFFDKIEIQLDFDKNPTRIRKTRLLEDIYDGTIINYDNAKDWPAYKKSPSYDDYDFLIITEDRFYDAITPLKDFREQSGIKTRIAKTTETGTSASSIKNYIKDAYNNEGIGYVLLVADVGGIPISENGDHYYTCLEGGDLFPEISIGRFSAKETSQVETIVDKTVDYDLFDRYDDYEKNILLAAHPQGAPGKYVGCKNKINDDIVPSEMNVNKVYPSEGGNKQDVIDYMNDGQLIVNYRGHGSESEWCDPKITASDLTNLNNEGKLPVIFSISCYNGKIDRCCGNECIAEHSHRDESSCIAYLGASRPSYTTPNHDFDKDLFRAIFDEELVTLGDIMNHGRVKLLEKHPNQYGRANVKMYILLGDPTTELSTGGPKLSFNPSSHDFGDMYKSEEDSTSFEICNSGSETLTYTLTKDCDWIDFNPVEGTLSEDECDTIDITIDTSSLEYGENICKITIESNDDNGIFEISVNIISHHPNKPNNPKPVNDASGIVLNPELSVDVFDVDDDPLTVVFHNAEDNSVIDSVENVQSEETVTVEWNNLDYDATYSWYVSVADPFFENQSKTYSFTTDKPPSFSNIYPGNGSTEVALNLNHLSVDIVDPDGDNFDWSITTSPDIGGNSSSNVYESTMICSLYNMMPNTIYNWIVTAEDSLGAKTTAVYSFKTRDNLPPEEPMDISPKNKDTNISIICSLNWSCIDPDANIKNNLEYDVYFGETSDPNLVEKEISESSYDITYDLNLDTTYYWKVVATDVFGASTESEVWSFKTSPIPPPPSVGSIDIDFPRKLCWSSVKTNIINKGVRDASNVKWSVSVAGGIINRINMSKSGCVDRLNSSETEEISTYSLLDFKSKVLGVGRVRITVKISNIYGEIVDVTFKEAFVVGPIVIFLD